MHLGGCSTFGNRKNTRLSCTEDHWPERWQNAVLHGKPFGITLFMCAFIDKTGKNGNEEIGSKVKNNPTYWVIFHI